MYMFWKSSVKWAWNLIKNEINSFSNDSLFVAKLLEVFRFERIIWKNWKMTEADLNKLVVCDNHIGIIKYVGPVHELKDNKGTL